MSGDGLRSVLGVTGAVVFYGGIFLGLLMTILAVLGATGGLPTEDGYVGAVSVEAFVVIFQAVILGGVLRLLVRIDRRLETLERKG